MPRCPSGLGSKGLALGRGQAGACSFLEGIWSGRWRVKQRLRLSSGCSEQPAPELFRVHPREAPRCRRGISLPKMAQVSGPSPVLSKGRRHPPAGPRSQSPLAHPLWTSIWPPPWGFPPGGIAQWFEWSVSDFCPDLKLGAVCFHCCSPLARTLCK